MAKLTKEEQTEYNVLKKRLQELENKPTIYGYARVSTRNQARDGNSLETQINQLKGAGAEEIYQDTFTGKVTERPEFNKMKNKLKSGDTLIVCKLDRLARSVIEGSELIKELLENDISVNVLNIGTIDNSSMGKLLMNVMLSFAEFERDMIIERTQEGIAQAKANNPNFKLGRKNKYTKKQLNHALELLENHTYPEVKEMTGISKSTLYRAKMKGGK